MEGELLVSDLIIIPALVLPILYFIGFTRNGKAYKVFSVYLLFIACIQVALFILGLYKENNIFLFSFYFIGQFIFMSLFYYFLLNKKWMWWVTGIVLGGLLLQYIITPSSFTNFNSFGVSITQSVIVIYAVIYYYKSLSGHASFLLLNTGILFYFLTSILFFASGNILLNLNLPVETHRNISLINEVLYVVFMVLIFIEWYRNYRVKAEDFSNYS